MLPRRSLIASLLAALARAPVVALLGRRQCGKTTLARQLVPVASANSFDLEDPISLARLEEPLTALAELRGTVVIDEVQRRPELFPILRVLADRADAPARFLILGSASPALLRQSSESLADRLENGEPNHLSPLSRSARRRVHGAVAAAMTRQPAQTPGEGPHP